MKRFLFGVTLLAVVLGVCIWVTRDMNRIHMPIAARLEQAGDQALSGELEAGIRLAQQARHRWEAYREITAAVVDHDPMDEIDGLFAQMESYAAGGSNTEFAGVCARIAQLIQAVAEANGFSWWSFL